MRLDRVRVARSAWPEAAEAATGTPEPFDAIELDLLALWGEERSG